MPGTPDLLFAFVAVVAYPAWDHLWGWPAMRRTLAAGSADARVRVYAVILRLEWGAAAVVAALWFANRRAWTDLGFGLPGGWRLAVSAVAVALIGALVFMQLRAIWRISEPRRAKLAAGIGDEVSLILPHTLAERAWFAALSVTAGICEELVYRGFLLWALRPWLGMWGAAAASLAGFTLAHAYQGRGFVVRTGGAGLLLTLLALGCGSIVPGIVLHALVDVLSGEQGYALLRDREPEGASA